MKVKSEFSSTDGISDKYWNYLNQNYPILSKYKF